METKIVDTTHPKVLLEKAIEGNQSYNDIIDIVKTAEKIKCKIVYSSFLELALLKYKKDPDVVNFLERAKVLEFFLKKAEESGEWKPLSPNSLKDKVKREISRCESLARAMAYKEQRKTIKKKVREQKALEQKALEQKALEQKALEQEAREQQTPKQKARELIYDALKNNLSEKNIHRVVDAGYSKGVKIDREIAIVAINEYKNYEKNKACLKTIHLKERAGVLFWFHKKILQDSMMCINWEIQTLLTGLNIEFTLTKDIMSKQIRKEAKVLLEAILRNRSPKFISNLVQEGFNIINEKILEAALNHYKVNNNTQRYKVLSLLFKTATKDAKLSRVEYAPKLISKFKAELKTLKSIISQVWHTPPSPPFMLPAPGTMEIIRPPDPPLDSKSGKTSETELLLGVTPTGMRPMIPKPKLKKKSSQPQPAGTPQHPCN